jgi:hypothetical protein
MRHFITALTLFALFLTFTACGRTVSISTDEIQLGSWNEDKTIFVNEWSNIKFTLPDGFRAVTNEEINLSQQLSEARGNIFSDEVKQRIIPDFYIHGFSLNGPVTISLAYQSIEDSQQLSDMDEATMIDMIISYRGIMEAQGMIYTELERGTRTIAGDEWAYVILSINDSQIINCVSIRKIGSAAMNLNYICHADDEDYVLSFLDTIAPVR